MEIMKKVIFIISILILGVSGLSAQSNAQNTVIIPPAIAHDPAPAAQSEGKNPTEKAKLKTDKMVTDAKLTEDQRSKVYDVWVQFFTDKEKITKTDPEKKNADTKAKLEDLKVTIGSKFQAILTPEQYKIVLANRKKGK
jgi:Spy/CpxP family protein refolding chaperone